jgi:hypothetical protein
MLSAYTFEGSQSDIELFNKYNTLNIDSVVKNAISDLVIFDQLNFKLKPTQSRYKLIDYIPTINVRYSTDLDDNGRPTSVWVSKDWSNIRLQENKKYMLPIYQSSVEYDENTLYIYRSDDIYENIYQTPSYFSIVNHIQLENEISIFNLAGTRNGWAPRLMITTTDNMEDAELRSLQEQLDYSYGGSNNAGKVVLLRGANPPTIEKIDYSLQDDSYMNLVETTRQYILSGHKCPSPVLAGIATQAGFDGAGNAIMAAYKVYDQMVVSTYRQILEKELNTVLELSGYNFKIRFVEKQLNIENDETGN